MWAVAIAGLVGSGLVIGTARDASAQTIKTPSGHPDYRVEIEPHFTLALFRSGLFVKWKGDRKKEFFGTPGVGGGFRASIEVADPAFIKDLNNTVGITFGMDVTSCDVCQNDAVLYFPLALQWNFFFSKEWNAFGELGPMIRADLGDQVVPDLYLQAGGRYLFNDTIGLTLRIGYPFISFGVSFLAG